MKCSVLQEQTFCLQYEAGSLVAGSPSVDAAKEETYEWLWTAHEHRLDLWLICIILDCGILMQNQISANISA